MQHTNKVFSAALTEGENQFFRHMCTWGTDGYPVKKLGRKWQFDKAFGVGGTPVLYATKAEAVKAVEAYLGILRDRMGGRLGPSPGSPAAALPEGWSEATLGGMATSRDPVNGGIVDQAIVSGEWFAIANRAGVAPLEGFQDRAAALDALAKALACTKL